MNNSVRIFYKSNFLIKVCSHTLHKNLAFEGSITICCLHLKTYQEHSSMIRQIETYVNSAVILGCGHNPPHDLIIPLNGHLNHLQMCPILEKNYEKHAHRHLNVSVFIYVRSPAL